ncbi:methyl-accepting chemotaxis protein [Vibrio sp. FNV 38]|nr:methyl-accepting chemotaxis protein [Vibrio sp. FNV 38]
MRVSQKIFSISLVAVLMLIGASVSSFLLSQKLIGNIHTIQNDRAVPLSQLKNISDAYAVNVIDALNKAHLNERSDFNALFNEIENTLDGAQSDWQRYKQNNLTNRERILANQVEDQFGVVTKNLKSHEHLLINQQVTLREVILATYLDVDRLSLHIDALSELQLDVVDQIYTDSLDTESRYQIIRVLYVLIGFSAFGVLSYKIIQSISSLLGAEPEVISEHLENMAGGYFAKFDNLTGKETGVFKSLTELANRQSTLLMNTHLVANKVASAAEELSCVMEDTANNTHKEKIQIENVMTAIGQLSATVREMAHRTTEAESAAKNASDSVQLGSEELNRSLELTSRIDRSIHSTAEVLRELKEETEHIEEVIDVINQISDQTNLLALNAAIEAARAGEQGRGFAVVADEVRNLAAKTQQSTQRIQAMIGNFQNQAEQANRNMLANQQMIENSVALSSAVESAFNKIEASVNSLSEANTMITIASNEQQVVTETVSNSADVILDIVNQNVSAIHQTKQASNELANLSNQQKHDLSLFKL